MNCTVVEKSSEILILKRVAVGIYSEFVLMGKNKTDGACQVLASSLRPRSVNQGKSIVALLREFEGMRETVVHRSHIGKGSAGIAHCKACSRVATEEEQSCVCLPWVVRLFFSSIN